MAEKFEERVEKRWKPHYKGSGKWPERMRTLRYEMKGVAKHEAKHATARDGSGTAAATREGSTRERSAASVV
jgi:hypothetical protein